MIGGDIFLLACSFAKLRSKLLISEARINRFKRQFDETLRLRSCCHLLAISQSSDKILKAD